MTLLYSADVMSLRCYFGNAYGPGTARRNDTVFTHFLVMLSEISYGQQGHETTIYADER